MKKCKWYKEGEEIPQDSVYLDKENRRCGGDFDPDWYFLYEVSYEGDTIMSIGKAIPNYIIVSKLPDGSFEKLGSCTDLGYAEEMVVGMKVVFGRDEFRVFREDVEDMTW